ncbi:uncharacterized protein METZ01_LOCUS515104, partial [marine metagenome]
PTTPAWNRRRAGWPPGPGSSGWTATAPSSRPKPSLRRPRSGSFNRPPSRSPARWWSRA